MRHYKYNLFLYVVAKHKLCGSRADSVVVLFLHSLLWVSLFTQTVYSGRIRGRDRTAIPLHLQVIPYHLSFLRRQNEVVRLITLCLAGMLSATRIAISLGKIPGAIDGTRTRNVSLATISFTFKLLRQTGAEYRT